MIRALWLTRSARPEDGTKIPENAVALDSVMKQRRLGMFPPSLGSAKLTATRSLASPGQGVKSAANVGTLAIPRPMPAMRSYYESILLPNGAGCTSECVAGLNRTVDRDCARIRSDRRRYEWHGNVARVRCLGWRYREVWSSARPLVRHRRSREGTTLRRRPLASRPPADKGSHRLHCWPPGVLSPSGLRPEE